MEVTPGKRLRLDLSKYEKLDSLQAGHIRHIHNLVSQLDGQWNHMGGQESLQEYFDAYRYQLANMAYSVAVAHYHRIPAAVGILKPLLRKIIHKMLLPDVWTYWYNSSQSGSLLDPGRTEMRKPWPDPVCRENIMYSGHLLLMVTLYAMLFDDDEFEKPGSISFTWAPMFWGFGSETFKYNTQALQDNIFAEMEKNKWVGVCCEPNAVFIVCNQYPLIAMRYNDVRHGRNRIQRVLKEYQNAWDEKGMVTESGLYISWLLMNQNIIVPPLDISLTAWANTFLNSWNHDLVASLYEKQAAGYITVQNDQVRLQTHEVAVQMRRLMEEENADLSDPAVLAKARALVTGPPSDVGTVMAFVLMWLSELGKQKELNGLLEYIDSHHDAIWEKGGLFYGRSDESVDISGNVAKITPLAGNACIAYSRLNVPNGQKLMWDNPWTSKLLASRPSIHGFDLSEGVDCLRSIWDAETKSLVLTVKAWEGRPTVIQPVAKNLSAGTWATYVNTEFVEALPVNSNGTMTVSVEVSTQELDIVFQKVAENI
ncbi:unnamed protein product [Clonostachys rosea]|uniref:Linalool dehydratase/isomerase domain-containing protein n=1 Tax=Bionectria ochroleuca TaxID=29856 RepID=A0ABY6UL80_BIOOC|nr:unnamed protein product [Clonostachys rosea]